MKKSFYLLVFISILLTSSLTFAFESELYSLYNDLHHFKIDTTRIGTVENLSIRRDVGFFFLEQGTMYACKAAQYHGKEYITGLIYIGKGEFTFTPPTEIEKMQLMRFYKDDPFKKEFDILFLRFADTTFSEIEKKVELENSNAPKKIKDEIGYCEKYIFEERNVEITYDLLLSIVQKPPCGYFYAHIGIPSEDPLFFSYNPYHTEEIIFAKRLTKLNYVKEVINSFNGKGEFNMQRRDSDLERDYFAVPLRYEMDATIESNGDLSSSCTITLKANAESLYVLSVALAKDLSVDSVVNSLGTKVPYIKDKERDELILFFDSPLKKGEEKSYTVFYKGNIMERAYGDFYLKSLATWYPRFAVKHRASYDMIFKTPEKYEFVTIGERIEDSKKDGYRTTRWLQEEPVSNASFNMGLFKKYEVHVEGAPPIIVLMSEARKREIALYLLEKYDIVSGKNMEKDVGADVANSIQLFKNIFGPFPYKQLYVSEIPYSLGVSFPGLLHLSWSTFQISDMWGENEIFRAHEVAHQWLGNSVGIESYHDAWLSEGFAQYCGLWYMQWINKDTKHFFKILDEWKNDVISNRKYLFGSGQEAGPISLGIRTSSSETEGDYSTIVYKKGAYVVHMLRNMLLDLKTMDDRRFTAMMKDFYSKNKGKDVSTEDFKKIVEQYCGEDMDWFFDQWVHGTDIPVYKVSYKTIQNPDGKYTITLRVEQEEVPPSFKMYVPITIKFKGDQFARLRLNVDQPSKDFTIPSPLKPEKIIFNDFNSVLAKVDYVKFEE
jgi:hypothetical protein